MIFAVAKEVIKGAEYRAIDTRVPFTGYNLLETRTNGEVKSVVRYNSISK